MVKRDFVWISQGCCAVVVGFFFEGSYQPTAASSARRIDQLFFLLHVKCNLRMHVVFSYSAGITLGGALAVRSVLIECIFFLSVT